MGNEPDELCLNISFWIKYVFEIISYPEFDVPYENCCTIDKISRVYSQWITDGNRCQMHGSIKYELLKSKWRDFSRHM